MIRRLLLASLLSLWAFCAHATGWLPLVAPQSVTFDANATSACLGSGGGSPKTCTNLTIGVHANECLVIQVAVYSGTSSYPTVTATWNSVSAPSIGTVSYVGQTLALYTFGLVAPATGNHAISVAFTGGSISNTAINGTSFYNCNQTGSTTTFTNETSTSGASGNPSLAITNPANNIAFNQVMAVDYLTTPQSGTLLYNDAADTGSGAQYTTSVNPTMTWTSFGSAAWVSLGFSIAHD